MKKVRWGILSTAKIGRVQVIPAMQRGEYSEVVAIASRDQASAQEAADQLGIPRAFGSYEAMLADPDIDAIYNPLPNHLHVPWTLKALVAGKHVLCEKPIALNAAEAQSLLEAARQYPQLKVMEAFMYRHHPQWQRTKQMVDEGLIGAVCSIQSWFSYSNKNADNIRNKADMGGGGLMDIGCYCISLSRFIYGSEPVRVIGAIQKDPDFGVDWLASGMLEFEQGTSTFTCGTQLAPYQRVNIVGESGRIEIEIPFNAPANQATTLWLHRAGNAEKITLEPCDQYTLQGDQFSLAILNDTPVFTPLEDAVANMQVIGRVFESAERGGWV